MASSSKDNAPEPDLDSFARLGKRLGRKWVVVSDDTGTTSMGSNCFGIASADSSDQDPVSVEVLGLRELLLEKTAACEALRTILFRSEQSHRMTINGMSKCIAQQKIVIEQNEIAMKELNAKFEQDAAKMQDNLNKYLREINKAKRAPSETLQKELAPGVRIALAYCDDLD